jgi:hypothetical protein
MSTCCSGFCSSVSHHFDAAVAEGDLKQYKTKGPNPTTRQLRDGIPLAGAGQSLLDISAGIGAASLELLKAGFDVARMDGRRVRPQRHVTRRNILARPLEGATP